MNFFEELKRRNVFKVGIAYLALSWLLVEASSTMAPMMQLPEWAAPMVLYVLIIGFPVALFVAWAFELTPDGVKRTHEVDPSQSITTSTGRKLDFIIIGVLGLALSWFVFDKFSGAPDDVGSEVAAIDTSIAVLPFVNMSSDPEQEYFSDGISEEILNALAQIPNLHVTSRSSSFQFKGTNPHIPTVATTLGVANVLEGSVRKSGNRVRITAQLIDAASNSHLWSQTYERELDDIFAIQDEISAAIVAALSDELGIAVEATPRVVAAANSEAHEAYLRGRYFMVQRTQAGIAAAEAEFRRAIELDPGYAPAFAELAITIELSHTDSYGLRTRGEARALARPFAERAMALAPTMAQSHAAMGFTSSRVEFRAFYNSALNINPSYSFVHHLLANANNQDGNYAQASQGFETALRLDPLSIPATSNRVGNLARSGRYGEAGAVAEKLKTISPYFYSLTLGFIRRSQGDTSGALLHFLDALVVDPQFGRAGAYMRTTFARLGLAAEAVAIRQIPLRPDENSLLGQNDKAYEAAKAAADENPGIRFLEAKLGRSLAGIGDYAAALPLLEAGWEVVNGQIGSRFSLFDLNEALALIAARRALDENADVSELIEAILDNARRWREVNYQRASDNNEGHARYLGGEHQRGLELIARGVEAGAYLYLNDAYIQDIYGDTGFAPIRANYEAIGDRERREFLSVVCNDNPYAAVWQPEPGTCEAFSAAGNGE